MKDLTFEHVFSVFIVLLSFWFMLSGKFDLFHVLIGVLSVSAVIALNYQFVKHQYFEDEVDVFYELRYGRVLLYVPWLIYEIILSGIEVAKVILRPSMPIEPKIIRFNVDLPSSHAKLILGNSITLTPGTLTVDINEDEFIVHALNPGAEDLIVSDKMPQKVLQLFTEDIHPVVSDIDVVRDREELS